MTCSSPMQFSDVGHSCLAPEHAPVVIVSSSGAMLCVCVWWMSLLRFFYGTGIVEMLANIYLLDMDLKEALDRPRLHQQLHPSETYYEGQTGHRVHKLLQPRNRKMWLMMWLMFCGLSCGTFPPWTGEYGDGSVEDVTTFAHIIV